MARRQAAATSWALSWKPNCQRTESTGRESNPRRRTNAARRCPGSGVLATRPPVRICSWSVVLGRLSYRPKRKKPGVLVTPGFVKLDRMVRPSVTIADDAGAGYSPVDRQTARRISVRECNSTARPSCSCSPPRSGSKATRRQTSLTVKKDEARHGRFARKFRAHATEDKMLEPVGFFPTAKEKSVWLLSRRPRPCRIRFRRHRTGHPRHTGRHPSAAHCRRSRTARLAGTCPAWPPSR